MAGFQQSPGVLTIEKDASLIVPGASSSVGATAGVFQWGPVGEPILLNTELDLVSIFGKPDQKTFASWYTVSNFLAYSNAMFVVRAVTGNKNATADGTGLLIKNATQYQDQYLDGSATVGTFAARYPGALGNSIKVSMADANTYDAGTVKSVVITDGGAGYASAPTVAFSAPGGSGVTATGTAVIVGGIVTSITITNPGSGYVTAPSVSFSGGTPTTPATAESSLRWEYADEFTGAPGTSNHAASNGSSSDELHIIVVDSGGLFSGIPGTVIEKFAFVSKASDAVSFDGTSNYYPNVIFSRSNYIYWLDHPTSLTTTGSAFGTSLLGGVAFKNLNDTSTVAYDFTYSLSGGTDDNDATAGEMRLAYDLFKDDQTYDISLIPVGDADATLLNYVINNVAEVRKDCVVFGSIKDSAGGPIFGTNPSAVAEAKEYRGAINSNYAVLDSGYKYQYDKYNDKFRWIPLNGDVAGLCARTDEVADPWFSPGGLNRGQVKNVVKLAWNPNKAQRDELYKSSINPVISLPGSGVVLFGDKTLTSKPSAFDRINVRRLFIVLEKSISKSAKYLLFEQNDAITRAQFVSMVEPFLRDVRGRRGIEEFKVICDESNNTPQVRAANEFRGTILIRPVYSINFIQLTFTAVGPNVQFEVAAQV